MLLLPLRPAMRCLPYVRDPKLIRWGRKAVKLARRHRSVARREHSGLTRGTDDNTFRIVSTAAPPHANSVSSPHGEGPKNLWLIQVSESSDKTWAGDSPDLAGRVSKASLPELMR
jgi:hypothetical protein